MATRRLVGWELAWFISQPRNPFAEGLVPLPARLLLNLPASNKLVAQDLVRNPGEARTG